MILLLGAVMTHLIKLLRELKSIASVIRVEP